MKKIILILTLTIFAFADKVDWLDYDSAVEKAQKENKMVAVMITNPRCGFCVKMHNSTLDSDKVKDTLENFFIPTLLDTSKDKLPYHLKVRGTPTFFFLDKKEQIKDRVIGYRDTNQFLSDLSRIMMRGN